jgi:hypothetical protein
MRSVRRLIACFCIVAAGVPGQSQGAPVTHYVSRSVGRDAYDGLAPKPAGGHGPWQTLAKASSFTYRPGDALLLKCGDTWDETLTLRGGGTGAVPVTVSAYGTGNRPQIRSSEPGVAPCVRLDKCAGVRIAGLEMADGRNAVRLDADSRVSRVYQGITIEDCFFRHIANPLFPNVAQREASQHNHLRKMGWAVYVDAFDTPEAVVVKDLTVRNCVSLWAQGLYIHMGAVSGDNIVFDSDSLVHNSYNSIYQVSSRRFSIKNTVLVYGYPWDFHPNGATQVLAGGLEGDAANPNEVIHNEFGWGGDFPGCPDGCAYDFEGATSGVVFRDNFMHNASGEPVLFMGGFVHKDLVFDRNTFRNNVRFSPRWDSYVTVTASNTGNGSFTNNRFFIQPGKHAFIAKPPSFTFSGNDENATGAFAEMPLVTRIASGRGSRAYTLGSRTREATIRYTTNGALPDERSPVYARPIKVTRSCAINAKAFAPGMNPSYVNCVAVDLRDAEGRAPITAAAASGVTDTFTVAFWVNPTGERAPVRDASVPADMAGQRFALSGEAGLGVSLAGNGISVFESSAKPSTCLVTDDIALAGRHHIAVVYRNRQPSLYIDGVFEKAGCRSAVPVRPLFTAGPEASGVTVYDRVLTDAEIQALAAGAGR